MHTFRAATIDDWREFLGVTTRRHTKAHNISVKVAAKDHAVMKGFKEDWVTPVDELYVIEKFWPNSTALATAVSPEDQKEYPLAWVSDYGGTRVFGTTIGHGNDTWNDPAFQDLARARVQVGAQARVSLCRSTTAGQAISGSSADHDEHAAETAPMIGQTLGHFEILEKLGEGGMGVVYKAHDTHLDRLVAIKVLSAERAAGLDRRRFVQEAKTASSLNHPGIVTIHDITSHEGIDFIAMELVPGRTLDRVIPRHGLPLPEALDYGIQIANAARGGACRRRRPSRFEARERHRFRPRTDQSARLRPREAGRARRAGGSGRSADRYPALHR